MIQYKYDPFDATQRGLAGGNTQTDLRTGIGQTDALVQSDNSSVSDVNYIPGVAERRGSTWTYNHSGIKNVDSQTNGSQTVSSTRVYDAFGAVVSSSGTHAGPLGYGGKYGYQEDSAGYKLLGDRWYAPEVGRFLTRDKAHDGRNWYVYCGNNPVTWADPSGYVAFLVGVAIGAAAIAIVSYVGSKLYVRIVETQTRMRRVFKMSEMISAHGDSIGNERVRKIIHMEGIRVGGDLGEWGVDGAYRIYR